MSPRGPVQLIRDPFWGTLVAALVVGLVGGTIAATIETDARYASLLGRAWRGDAAETRGILVAILGVQITVLTVVMSVNTPMIESAANQYSPRLVPYYLKSAPVRRAFPLFVMTAGYILAALRELGLVRDDVVRPRVVLSGAVVLAVLSLSWLAIMLIRTFRFFRVERVLTLVRQSTFATIARLGERARRLPLAPASRLLLPDGATPVRARTTGYLVDVDARALYRIARRNGVSVRVCRAIGDFVDRGEIVGWVGGHGTGLATPEVAVRLAARLATAPVRAPDLDPLYGVRILADVAARALSPAGPNDSYTARQALQQLRSVLRRAARAPLGDWSLVDGEGTVRVSLLGTELRELVSVAVEAPLRLGAGDPEVLDGILEIALELGLVEESAQARAIAEQLISRVLADAGQYGDLRDGRLQRLLAEVALVRASLERDVPRLDRHLRSDWALTLSDEGLEAGAPHESWP
jgi:uncharacterized membrane protein